MSHVCEWPCPVGHAVQLSCPIVLVGLTAWPLQLMQTNETLWNELISRQGLTPRNLNACALNMYNLQHKDACHSGTQLRNFHFLTDTRVIKASTR